MSAIGKGKGKGDTDAKELWEAFDTNNDSIESCKNIYEHQLWRESSRIKQNLRSMNQSLLCEISRFKLSIKYQTI